ncbi:MAG: prolipoprotein diacylglyceryl transferase [Oscillospiraceae bacterium]|nr:prolipoprotein diacylglyceryl transferase [Oscillospiraceae bacterium]
MHPILFTVLGRTITSYGVLVILATALAWLIVALLTRRKIKDIGLVFLMCIAGGFVGVVLLRPIMRIPAIIANWQYLTQFGIEGFIGHVFGELVFYGGLIGGIIAMALFCRGFKIPILPIADVFAPALAVAHGIGRIGCFLGSCCYGIAVDASHPFAVVFPKHALSAPPGVPLLAVQLIEAACLFLISAILIIVYKKGTLKGLTVCLYGILYSITRFVLEFFRGDLHRGIYGGLSTSQYISIVLLIGSVVLLWLIVKQSKRQGDGSYLSNIS